MSDPVITYDYDAECSCLDIFIDLKLIVTWNCEDDPEECLKEFRKIFDLGVMAGRNAIKEEVQEL